MNPLEKLRKERAELLAKAQGHITAAKGAARELTPTEAADVEAVFARVGEIDTEVKKYEDSQRLIKELDGLSGSSSGGGRSMLAFSEEQKDGFAHALSTKGMWRADVPQRIKAAGDATAVGPLNLPPTNAPGYAAQRPSGRLADLLLPLENKTGTVKWYSIKGGVADLVDEGAPKPDAEIYVDPHDEKLAKIANQFRVTDEFSEDAPELLAMIGEQATIAVVKRENRLLIDRFAATSGIMAADATTATLIDDIADAIAATESLNEVTPAALALNPLDLATIRKAKGSGSGDYALDPTSAGPRVIHGVPLWPAAGVPSGTMWLITPGAGTFHFRSGIRIETGYAGDDFVENKIRVRVEERVLPVLNRPSYITEINIAPAA